MNGRVLQDPVGLRPMPRLVIVYHDPGDPEGHLMVERLLERVCKGVGLTECTKTPISEVEEGKASFSKDDLVYALFLGRGGHFETVKEAVYKAGARLLGSIPPRLVAEALAPTLKGCKSVDLAYWPAKRFVERHMADLEEARRALEKALGVPVRLRSKCEGCNADCIVGYTLMPGRLSRKVESLKDRAKASYLLPYLEGPLVEYVEKLVEEALGAGRS